MARLSDPIEQIKNHYTVVIVGSGYGASIAASRLARAGQQVAVLERGKEFQPGDYPDTQFKALAEIHAVTPEGVVGAENSLYELNVNRDINVFKGCGLGGTSLVNANVSLRAEPRVFEDPRWPKALRDDAGTLLQEGYQHAEAMLKPVPYPDNFPRLPKLEAHERAASAMQAKFYRTPINVNFTLEGPNHVGVQQHPCADCGDCVTGCNYAAKNTLIMNYLPDAKNHGAEIFTQVDVRWVEPKEGKWLVHCRPLGAGREKFRAPDLTISADVLVLGGGSLGSTEILLRSKQHGVALSDRAGEDFTGNGDTLGFAYNTKQVINGVGWGHHRPGEIPPVGPCITGVIDIRNQPKLEDGMIIEEGSPPGALAGFLPAALAAEAGLIGRGAATGAVDRAEQDARDLFGWVEGPYHGPTARTQTYLVMTHDDGAGRMSLAKDDRLHIDWPGVGAQPIFEKVNQRLEQATEALGGEYVHNPLWSKLLHNNLITVHPLGGCVMAEDAEHGVVNHKCQVFAGAHGNAVYDNLYVADGSVIPLPLGVNPLLTISAVAERAMAILARDRNWQINYDLPSKPAAPVAAPKVGIEFTETMSGYFSNKVKDDYQRGSDQGKADGSSFVFTLTIISEDVDEMISNPQHAAPMMGTVNAPALSPNPLTVTGGTFNLFVVADDDPAQRRMRYRMRLVADEGKAYYFEGFKIIKDDPAWDVWAATTTLYITLYDGADNQSPVLGKGILIIKPQDFLRQMSTMKATNGSSAEERMAAEARFGRFFLGVLLDKYGKVFRWPSAS